MNPPHKGRSISNLFARFVVIWVLITRIPLPKCFWPDNVPPGNKCLQSAPIVGGVLGCLTGAFITALNLLGLADIASVWLGLTFYVLSGWALHLDGWCDVWDGLGSGRSGEELRSVMKDSRLGAYGAIGLVLAIGLWTSVAGSIGAGHLIIACMVAAASGRFAMCAAALFGHYPWNSGMGKGWVDTFTAHDLFIAMLCVLVFLPFAPFQWLISVILAFVTGYFAAWRMNKKLGGVNGDVLGASAVAAELFSMMVFSL